MKNFKYILVLSFLLSRAIAQVSIVSSSFHGINVEAKSIMQVSILNNQQDKVQVIAEAILTNSQNEVVLKAKTMPFTLTPGLNNVAQLPISFSSAQYGTSKQAEYIRTTKILPSGIFKYCVTIVGTQNTEATDSYCDEIQSDFSNFLTLIYPSDKDSVLTQSPALIWSHSEPFDILTRGESYRMIVVELGANQDATSGINMNNPILIKDFLTLHQVVYPFDAPALQPGKKYGWQVQKIAEGRVVNSSEAWEFVMAPQKVWTDQKFAVLSTQADAGVFEIESNKLFFTFSEEYNSTGNIRYYIFDDMQQQIQTEMNKTSAKEDKMKLKQMGDNRFMIDFSKSKLNPGYYHLKVLNEKNEAFFLKFHVN